MQPDEAAQTFDGRVKRINKVNVEIADWLQVTHLCTASWPRPLPSLPAAKKKAQPANGLPLFHSTGTTSHRGTIRQRLAKARPGQQGPGFAIRAWVRTALRARPRPERTTARRFRSPIPDGMLIASTFVCHCSVLQAPWAQIVKAVERIAQSHEIFCQALNEQVERPLRAFQQDAQVANLSNVSSNLNSLAKALQDAQSQSDKLNKKGKSNENVFLKLRDATQAWDAEAPLIFENLEDLDVSRIQRLQEKLDQYQTQESEQAARLLEIADETKNVVGRIDATAETHGFAARTTLGRPSLPTRTSTRMSSMAPGRQTSFDQPPPVPSADTSNSNASALNPPPTRGSQSQHEDEFGDQFSNDQLKGG